MSGAEYVYQALAAWCCFAWSSPLPLAGFLLTAGGNTASFVLAVIVLNVHSICAGQGVLLKSTLSRIGPFYGALVFVWSVVVYVALASHMLASLILRTCGTWLFCAFSLRL